MHLAVYMSWAPRIADVSMWPSASTLLPREAEYLAKSSLFQRPPPIFIPPVHESYMYDLPGLWDRCCVPGPRPVLYKKSVFIMCPAFGTGAVCPAFGTGAVCPARGRSSINNVSLSCVRPLGPVLCARPAAWSLLKQCVLIHIIVRTRICILRFILLEKTAEKIVKSTALHQQKREQHIHSARLTAVSAASPCSH